MEISETMEWLNGEAQFDNYLKVNIFFRAEGGGVSIQVIISNIIPGIKGSEFPHIILTKEPEVTMLFARKLQNMEKGYILLRDNLGLSYVASQNGIIDTTNLLFHSGEDSPAFIYYSPITAEQWEEMMEVSKEAGVVELVFRLSVPFTLRMNAIDYKFNLWRQEIPIKISRADIEDMYFIWSKNMESMIDAPKNLPPEVFSDIVEASKCLNIGASKAAIVMARRALEQALIIKGAKKNDNLLDQIDDIKQKKLLSDSDAHLAHGIRYLGNYGAHPEDDLLKDVNLDDAKLAFQVVSKILKNLFR